MLKGGQHKLFELEVSVLSPAPPNWVFSSTSPVPQREAVPKERVCVVEPLGHWDDGPIRGAARRQPSSTKAMKSAGQARVSLRTPKQTERFGSSR